MPNHYSSLYKSRQISRSNQFSRLDNIYVIHSLNIGLQKIEKQRHEHSTKYLIMFIMIAARSNHFNPKALQICITIYVPITSCRLNRLENYLFINNFIYCFNFIVSG